MTEPYKTPGQIAYEAWQNETFGQMQWDHLPDVIQLTWEQVAKAVLDSVKE